MPIRARNLLRDIRQHGREVVLRELTEAIELHRSGRPGGVAPEEFSLRDLFEHLVVRRSDNEAAGREVIESWQFGLDGSYQGGDLLLEAGDAVDSTMFANISGQLMFSRILQGYTSEAFYLSNLVPTVPSSVEGAEKVPGIGRINEDDAGGAVGEGQEYPRVGVSEEYIVAPAKEKHGFIVPITKEAVRFDRTGLLLTRASETGQALGSRKEKELVDVLIGAVNPYIEKRRGIAETARNTYYSAADSTPPWINHLDGNALTDWSSVDEGDRLLADMVDPNTGEPIVLTAAQLLCTPANRMTMNRILNATEVRSGNQAGNTVISGNPLRGVSGVASALIKQRLVAMGVSPSVADGYWFYGDVRRALAWFENWPITVAQAPTNSEADFTRDIVVQFKASYRGAAAMMEPRAITRHRGLATSSSGS